MKLENIPFEISKFVPFTSSFTSSYSLKTPVTSFSGISKNGLWMWIVQDCAINIYHTENSEWSGGYCFGQSLKNPSAKITAVLEFCSSHISFPCLLISVNQDHESLICLYDVKASQVVRAVLVPDTVLKMEVISGNGGACVDTHHLYVPLRYMFGIVALGTSSGHLYILDLCLDEDFICDENLPNITFVLNKYDLTPELRERLISKQQHVFMLLNDQSARNGSFDFESRSSSLGHFPYGKVQVTAVKYIQSAVTLALGFNFGGVQLWNLQDLCLLYTLANQTSEQAIINFAFQEPENDPRSFCYLWVIRGHAANEKPEDFSVASMYSLTFYTRTYIKSFGNLYMDLQSCSKRFEYPLTSDPFSAAQSSTSIGSCLLSCQTVCQFDSHYLDASSSNDSDTATENMSLCFLSWLVWSDAGNSPTSYHLALFDLNQWYQSQMPSFNFRANPSDLVSYLAHYSLEEVIQNFAADSILGLYVIPHSIKKFKYILPSEEFFYPSSLDFQAIVHSHKGINKVSFLGLQKNMLYEITDKSPNILINPKEIYCHLIRCGLISDSFSNSDRVSLIVLREALLQLALEYHIPVFFMKCLKEWKYADSIQEGCTSRALLLWAWKKVIHIKNSIDKINLPLFNCVGSDIDKASLKVLHSYRRQLDLIDTIFLGYQKFATPRTEQGIQELKCRRDVVSWINMYLQVVLWLRSVHVLPEVCEGEETENNVFYPVSNLVNAYAKRRAILQKIHSSIGLTDILLIDGLVKDAFSENTWQEKGGNGIYPPPSVYAALSCYLLNEVPLDLKHSLMYYFLLDICNVPSNLKNSLTRGVKKFPVIFGMSQSIKKLVKAFWYLDQFNFEAAIKKLLHPAVNASDILPWQHQRIIKSFLFQKEAQKALKYINHMNPPENTVDDMKLHLSVLISRGAITHAFDYQRSKQPEGFGSELLSHLFLGCQETHTLKDIMYMPLNALESSAFIKFLLENKDPCAQEALVMYYLLRCNFFEAAKVNEKLSLNITNKSSVRERTVGREALVESLLASVPKIEKNLVEEINRIPFFPIKKREMVKPLSLSVKSAPLKQISYSDILNSLISDASSPVRSTYLDTQTPLKSANKSHYDNIPFLRPPLTPECSRLSSEPMYSTPVPKRMLTSPVSEFSSPTKKSRLLDNVTFKASSLMKRKIPKHLVGDVASLLQSPPVPRRGSNVRESIRSSAKATPQGILKNKVESSKFPVSDTHISRTPSVLSDAGESSEVETMECEKMIIDNELPADAPGRQIRFAVPPKEDLNLSVLTSVSESSVKEEPIEEDSKESSDFVERELEDVKSTPAYDSFESTSKDFTNISYRRNLVLTREPLKAHSLLHDIRFPTSEPSKISHHSVSSVMVTEKTEQSSSSYSLPVSKTASVSEALDSDLHSSPIAESVYKIISTNEDLEQPQHDSKSSDVCLSSNILSSTLSYSGKKELDTRSSPLLISSSSMLNRSGSSSGSSSYNSASERSLIITPRRPLRDNSRNVSASDCSMMSTTEDIKDETICPEVEKCPINMDGKKTFSQCLDDSESNDEQCATEVVELITPDTCPISSSSTVKKLEEIVNISEGSIHSDESTNDSSVILITTETSIPNKQDEDDGVSQKIDEEVCEKFCSSSEIAVSSCSTQLSQSVSESFQNSNLNIDLSSFAKATPSLPKYIPIKERISRSSQKNTEFSTYENEPDVKSKILSELEFAKSGVNKDSFITSQTSAVHNAAEPSSSYDVMDTDKSAAAESSDALHTCTLLNKSCPKDLSARIDFMSKNSDLYENNKLYKNAMRMLKEEILPDSYDYKMERKPIRKTRTFVFTRKEESISEKSGDKSESAAEESEDKYEYTKDTRDEYSEKIDDKSEASNEAPRIEFLESWHPETYEQFSHSIRKEVSDAGSKILLKSSPNTGLEKHSVPSHEISEKAEHACTKSKEKIRKKQSLSTKNSSLTSSVDKTPKSSIKKAKGKSKVTKKMEFSFADPISPAGPEILEALATPSEHPVASFMFSPPLTRGRLRQKRMDDTLGSSFNSVTSETSFVKQKKPPIDPILEEIIAEKAPESKDVAQPYIKSKTKSITKKKSSEKTSISIPPFEMSDISLDTSELVESGQDVPRSKILLPAKHTMVLRQGKMKPRTKKLF